MNKRIELQERLIRKYTKQLGELRELELEMMKFYVDKLILEIKMEQTNASPPAS